MLVVYAEVSLSVHNDFQNVSERQKLTCGGSKVKKKLSVYIATESLKLDKMIEDFSKFDDYTMTIGRGSWTDDDGEQYIEREATFVFLLNNQEEVTITLNVIRSWLLKNSLEQAIAYDVHEVEGGVLSVAPEKMSLRDKIEADNSLRLSEKFKAIWARHKEVSKEQQEKSQINPGCLENPINHVPGWDADKGTGYSGHPRCKV